MTLNLSAIQGGIKQDEDLVATLALGMKGLIALQQQALNCQEEIEIHLKKFSDIEQNDDLKNVLINTSEFQNIIN